MSDKSYFKSYIFEGRKGQQISIEMNSSEIDPFLQILDSQGRILAANDDIAPNNLNAIIAGKLPEDDTYIVIAGASKLGISGRSETGNYSITAISRP